MFGGLFMNELRLVLNKRLSQLESESGLIDQAVQEIHRRFNVLDDVESWGLLPKSDGVSPTFESSLPESDGASPTFESSLAELIEEEEELELERLIEEEELELDMVNAEREEDFEFAISGQSGAERATGADGL